MGTIRKKIIYMATVMAVLSSVIIGSIIIKVNKTNFDNNIEQILIKNSHGALKDIDLVLGEVEQTAEYILHRTMEYENSGSFDMSAESRSAYIAEMEEVLYDVVELNETIETAYFQWNPEVIPAAEGVRCKQKDDGTVHIEYKSGEFPTLQEEDFRLKEQENFIWMKANENNIISCIVPVYREDIMLAVVGMDLPIEYVLNSIAEEIAYDSGYVCIINQENQLVYHPYEENVAEDMHEWQQVVKRAEIHNKKDICNHMYKGKHRLMMPVSMKNGMYFVYLVSKQEVKQQNSGYYLILAFSFMVAFILSLCIVAKKADRMLHPLTKLKEAVDQVTLGNYQVSVVQRSNDEIEILSDSIQKMLDITRLHMNEMNALAYKDPLTRVRNKAAFNEEIEKYDDRIRMGYDMFGVIVFDVNNLKIVNDERGHDAGDIYLNNCCQLICKTYEHSPVFRIGGDEFIAILEKQDFANAVQLQERFYNKMEEICNVATEIEEKVSIASGMAFYCVGDSCFQDIFKRADEAMYKNKKRIKAGKKPSIGFPRVSKW